MLPSTWRKSFGGVQPAYARLVSARQQALRVAVSEVNFRQSNVLQLRDALKKKDLSQVKRDKIESAYFNALDDVEEAIFRQRKLQKESPREFALRWAARGERDHLRQVRRDAMRRWYGHCKVWLNNRFWKLPDQPAFSQEPEPLGPYQPSKPRGWRKEEEKAMRAAARFAAAATNHVGRVYVEKRVPRSFAAFIAATSWEWDSVSHTLTWAGVETPELSKTMLRRIVTKAFTQVKAEVDSVQEEVKKSRLARRTKFERSAPRDVPCAEGFSAQMDAQKEDAGEVSKHSETVTAESVPATQSSTMTSGPSTLRDMCSTSTPVSQDTLAQREFRFASGTWKTTDAMHTVLHETTLPSDIICKWYDQPNFALFNNHKYWQGDIVVDVKIVSNARQFGQLQCSWYYCEQFDANAEWHNNVYTNSQTNHCLVTANNSNPATLHIQYRYPKPFLNLKRKKKTDGSYEAKGAMMGKLRLMVLVPLTVAPTNTSQSANWSMHIRFENNHFAGPVQRSLVVPQMVPAMIAYMAAKNMFRGDNNRDLPVHPSLPSHMKPVLTDNWAAGTDQHRTAVPLRLDPHALTPYPSDRSMDTDEMKVNAVASVFGLVNQIEWNAQHMADTCLAVYLADPIQKKDKYYAQTSGESTVYSIPPIAVLSSMFSLWRGELEFKFDVVCTADLGGKLMIAYVPDDKEQTFDVAMGSHVLILDVSEKTTITFRVPYVSDRPWRTRRYKVGTTSSLCPPHGLVHVFVHTPLIVNNTVPDKCVINVYMRGSDSFEVAVPSQPIVGLCWNPAIRTGDPAIQYFFKHGYYPVYCSTWRMFGENKTILRYGSTTDHVAQLDDNARLTIVQAKTCKTAGYFKFAGTNVVAKMTVMYGGDPRTVDIIGVMPWVSAGYCYAIPVNNTATIRKYWNAMMKSDEEFFKVVFTNATESDYYKCDEGPNMIMEWKDINLEEPAPNPLAETVGNIVHTMAASTGGRVLRSNKRDNALVPNMDGRVDPGDVTLAPGGFARLASMQTLGEKFDDLKDIIRRTSAYLPFVTNVSTIGNIASLIIPVMPQGLALDIGTNKTPNYVWNFMREGNMQIIASGYRFYAGSLGFQIKCWAANNATTAFFVQHRPLSDGETDQPTVLLANSTTATATDRFVLQHGYATMVQSTNNSCMLEVEVPHYQPGSYGLLQRPDFKKIKETDPELLHFATMGDLVLGTLPNGWSNTGSTSFQCWVRGGDDLRFMVFQGFPPMIFLTDPPAFKIKPAVQVRDFVRIRGGSRVPSRRPSTSLSSDFVDLAIDADVVPQMHIPILSDLASTMSNIKNTTSRVDGFVSQMTDVKVAEVVDTALNDIKETKSYTGFFNTLYGVVSNVVHCLISPCWETVVWAVCSTFQFMFNLGSTLMNRLTDLFTELFSFLARPFRRQENSADCVAQMETDKPEEIPAIYDDLNDESFLRKHCASILAVVCSGIISFIGYGSISNSEVYKTFAEKFVSITKMFTLTANGLLTFFKGTIDMLKDMFDWCVRKVCPSWDAVSFLADNDKDLHKWAKRVQVLTDGRNRNNVLTNPMMISELYATANEACLIRTKLMKMDKKISNNQLVVLMKLINDITRLRDQASGMHIAPPVKFEPFVLHLTGPPKVGKSHLLADFCIDMLDSIGYRTMSEPVYIRNGGNDYWNNLVNQPIVVYDDFLAVLGDNWAMTQISELFQLKTRSVFNPPMASVEDKCIRYNPIIVGIASNAAYWNLTNVTNMQAVHRRRDLLVDVILDPEKDYKTTDDVPYSELAEYKHLRFRVYERPEDATCKPGRCMTFQEFKTFALNKFKEYYQLESRKYRDISANLFRLVPKMGEHEFSFANHEVGEALDRYFTRKAEKTTWEDQLLRHVCLRMRGMNEYKKTRIMQEMRRKILGTIEKDPEVIKKQAKGKKQYTVAEALLEAYAEEQRVDPKKLEMEIEKDHARCKEVSPNESLRLKLAEAFNAQMGKTGILSGEEIDAQLAKLPDCLHRHVIRSDPAPSEIEWIDESKVWRVSSAALQMAPIVMKEAAAQKWVYDDKDDWKLQYVVKDGLHAYLEFSHTACGSTMCPFQSLMERHNFVTQRILADANLSAMKMAEDPDLAQKIPPEYTVDHAKPPEEIINPSWLEKAKKTLLEQPWGKIMKILGYVSAAIGMLFGMVKFWNWRKGEKQEEPENKEESPQLSSVYSYGSSQPRQQEKSKKVTARKMVVRMGKKYRRQMDVPQYMLNPSLDECATSVVRRNTFFITVSLGGKTDEMLTARCFGLVGHLAIFPLHYMDAWDTASKNPDTTFYIEDSKMTDRLEIKYEELEMQFSDTWSVGFMWLPERYRLFKDVRNHFISVKDVPDYDHEFKSCLFELQRLPGVGRYELVKNFMPAHIEHGCKIMADGVFDEFRIDSDVRYPYGGAGVCGSLLFNTSGKIVAMHVAGRNDKSHGIGELIKAEELMLIKIEPPVQDAELPDDLIAEPEYAAQCMPYMESRTVVCEGWVDNIMKNYVPNQTSLRRTNISGDLARFGFPCEKEPAVLRKTDPRIADNPFSPLQEGIKHHGMPMLSFDPEHIKQAVADLKNVILAKCRPLVSPPRKLTVEEACMGVKENPHILALDWTSSTGWPYRCDDRKDACAKKAWIKLNEEHTEFLGLDPELEEFMEIKHEQRMANEVPFTVFADILKDETLKSEKATRPGGTRVVSMSPLDFTIQQRQYTMDFVSAYMEHRLNLEHAIGINPDSEEWTRLYRCLASSNGYKHFIAGDYSKFGDRLPAELGHACYKIISDWYYENGLDDGGELAQVLKIMGYEVFQARHIVNTTIYRCVAGQPSGNTMTVILNSMVNSLFLRIAWLSIMAGTPFQGLDKMKQYTTLYTYGDDMVMGVDEKIIDQFNTITLQEFFAKYDLKFTDADKEGAIRKFRNREEVVFLKRKWQLVPAGVKRIPKVFFLAPVDRESIAGLAHWKNKSRACDMEQNLSREMCRLAFTNGKDYYDNVCNVVRKIWQKRSVRIDLPTWEELYERVYEHNEVLSAFYVRMRAQDPA